jgi:multicomponent Na+:H+ antiporter subunit D
MKMCAFLCAGAFMHQTGKNRVYEMDGMGRRMKVVFGCFAVSALGLMGVPGLAGFVSKWNLTAAAVDSGNVLAFVGIGCLLVSALLTAIYMLGIVVRAYFPRTDAQLLETADPSWQMCLPLLVCAAGVVVLGLFSEPLIAFFRNIAFGIY